MSLSFPARREFYVKIANRASLKCQDGLGRSRSRLRFGDIRRQKCAEPGKLSGIGLQPGFSLPFHSHFSLNANANNPAPAGIATYCRPPTEYVMGDE